MDVFDIGSFTVERLSIHGKSELWANSPPILLIYHNLLVHDLSWKIGIEIVTV